MQSRLQRLRETLSSANVDAFVVTDILNVRYISGFTGSTATLLVDSNSIKILTDSRYMEQLAQECPSATIIQVQRNWTKRAAELITDAKYLRVGLEYSIPYRDWESLNLLSVETELVPMESPINQLRWKKDDVEILAIRHAARITDMAFKHVLTVLRPDITERDVAVEIECFMRRSGAESEAFDTIVAAGPRSAMPHARSTNRRIGTGSLAVMDFGARHDGYHADITRTVLIGTPSEEQQRVYNTVLNAQRTAMEAIRPGVSGGAIDSLAREYIEKSGYGAYFGHGLGHGLGLDVHDGAILAKDSRIILEAGMVVTVEPGIYIPGWGGVRIEDDVLVTENGYEILTHSDKSLAVR
ncbi:MAG TPA: Xaa-Pro dipeptidase [Armatimonadetes bacterium]|nr:Xaa-Pro dipeptidase [Armatimonadota bacterium]